MEEKSKERCKVVIFFAGILLGCTVALYPSRIFGAAYYVNNTIGKDTFTGTNKTAGPDGQGPFATIGAATKKAKGADEVHLADTGQPYYEHVVIQSGGTVAKPFIFDGHGAVIRGSAEFNNKSWEKIGDDLYQTPCPENLLKRVSFLCLFSGDKRLERPLYKNKEKHKALNSLKPLEWCILEDEQKHMVLRTHPGKAPADYQLELSTSRNGISISAASNVIIRNVICERFWNNGFSIHGPAVNVVYEKVIGRYNGDEGLSIHENANAIVRDSEFCHNFYNGVADVYYSQTSYYGVTSHHNRESGAEFYGGIHAIYDSSIHDNRQNVVVGHGGYPTYPHDKEHPMARAKVYLRNLYIGQGDAGITVASDSEVIIDHCTIEDTKNGVTALEDTSRVFLVNSCIQNVTDYLLDVNKHFAADYNLYSNGILRIKGQKYDMKSYKDYVAQSGFDANSVFEEKDAPAFGENVWGGKERGCSSSVRSFR